MISVLTLFIVIAAPRPVNKNVSTGAVIIAKCGTEPGVHKLGTGELSNHNAERYRQTDEWTEYMMMSTADQTVYQYDRLKSIISNVKHCFSAGYVGILCTVYKHTKHWCLVMLHRCLFKNEYTKTIFVLT